MSKTTRKLLSQNFLWNRGLVSELIRNSSISQNDHVLEIGSGLGIITQQLLGRCRKVTAVETDEKLFSSLRNKFRGVSGLALVAGNFLTYPLPLVESFKIFSNLPFSITGEIVKKLLFSKNPPVDSYLVVQREAADKFVANNSGNTMLAILFCPWFDIEIIYRFERSDFRPAPRVDPCLIRITKRQSPSLDRAWLSLYRDFVVYHFTRDRSASTYSPDEWLARFDVFVRENDRRQRMKVVGSFQRWRTEEKRLAKIHRTRTDRHWKNLKST